MIQSSSGKHAKSYFSDALSKSDYYLNDQELNGKFQGHLASRLGLDGIATKENFFALCENVNPNTGSILTQRTKDERTVGYDINFHCPKSVSIIHALSKDDHLLDAFQKSVGDTMRDIEADSKTRVRKKGKYEDRNTGELIWADFVHQTARPVEGHSPDPHLHSHCFVFNVTWDDIEKQFKAGQFRDIKRDMPYYQARFHKRLSDQLIKLGYSVKRTEKSFEIEGVPQRVIELFSKRTDEIGRVAKEKGITNEKELGELGARTRSKKQKGMSMSDLKEEWKKQINELSDEKKREGDIAIRFDPNRKQMELNSKTCVDHALHHAFERASVVADRRILADAYRHGMGDSNLTVDEITDEFKKNEEIIEVKERSRTLCTTRQVLSEEKRMVELARSGQGKLRPLYEQAPKLNLEGQQADAVTHLLTTSHRVSIIRGAAGTGKTTLMREAVHQMEKGGRKVFTVAPTAQASRGTLREEGFESAETVAKLLVDKNLQNQLQDQVLWVDEAGLLGTKDMSALLELAERKNARLILGGDTRQHSSVVRGDALRILNTVAGIRTAEVSKIYRQKNKDYREAVEDLSKGNVRQAFEKLDAIESIKTVDPLKPNEALIEDYMKVAKKGKSALVISPTHAQGEELTKDLRKKLRSSGMLGKKEIAATKLSNLNLTEAEKKDWRNFKEGQVVQFNQNQTGIKRGSLWSIANSSKDEIELVDHAGNKISLPIEKFQKTDLFRKSELHLSKGDKVNITRNGFDENKKRLNNGQEMEVVSINRKGEIVLRNQQSKASYKLDKDFGHINHAYCVTSHSSQGKTVDEVFISQPASTFPATDSKQFYVSVSRGRNKAHIYTDDKDGLLEHASELGDRYSAIELVKNKNTHSDFVMKREREKQFEPSEKIERSKDNSLTNKINDRDYEPGF